MPLLRRLASVLVLVLAFTLSASQSAVLAVYPQATCVKLPFDTKYKVFINASDHTPLGYGTTADAAWDDAAAHLPHQ